MNSLLSMTEIISGQQVLILDDLNHQGLNYLRFSSKDFRKVVSRKEYMNHFDVIFCPKVFYSLTAKNRQFLMQIIVWLMSRSSKFLFSVPNINYYLNNKEYKIKEKKDYYRVIKKTGFLRENVEYWYKEVIDDPISLFRQWNLENSRSKWLIDKIISINHENYSDFSIDIFKEI